MCPICHKNCHIPEKILSCLYIATQEFTGKKSGFLNKALRPRSLPSLAPPTAFGRWRRVGLLGKMSTVHKICSENLIQYLGRSNGPYPFGNLGIQPKMRSGQRFENQNQCLQPCMAPNCKNQFSGGVNCQKGL